MRLIFPIIALLLGSCATTGQKPVPKSVADVNVGDKLSIQVGTGQHSDCTLTVSNIITAAPTQGGLMPIPPVVCGIGYCSRGSIPQYAMPTPTCEALEGFLEDPRGAGGRN